MKSIDKKGFTLIELIFVIIILAILSVIAIPNIEQAKVASQVEAEFTAEDEAELINETTSWE